MFRDEVIFHRVGAQGWNGKRAKNKLMSSCIEVRANRSPVCLPVARRASEPPMDLRPWLRLREVHREIIEANQAE